MPRIKSLTSLLAIWVFADDHAPPHFHVLSPDTDVQIDLRTLKLLRGTYKRRQLATALDWVAEPGNLDLIKAEWSRLNERD